MRIERSNGILKALPRVRVRLPCRLGGLRLGRLGQDRLDLLVAFGDQGLVLIPDLHGLAQRKQVFRSPRAAQRLADRLTLLMADLRVAQRQQAARIALAGQYRPHHPHSAHARYRADRIVQLDVHALQRLLHLLHLAGRFLDVVVAQANKILQAPNVGRGHKPRLEQPVHVQGRPPLAIGNIGLAARQVLRLPTVDHRQLQPRLLQDAVQRQPVHPRGFHRHGIGSLLQQPVAQRLQLRGHRAKDLRRAPGYGYVHLLAAHVHERGMRIQHRQISHDASSSLSHQRDRGRAQLRLAVGNLSSGKPRLAKIRNFTQPGPISPTGFSHQMADGHAARPIPTANLPRFRVRTQIRPNQQALPHPSLHEP